MKEHLFSFLAIFLLCLFTSASAQTTHYVKEGGTGDGTSWANASGDLQLMINSSVPGDQVWVARGTYYPIRRADALNTISINDRHNAFVLNQHVKIYGGFAGTETIFSTRNLSITTNASILSGNLGDPNTNTDNAHHVVLSVGDVGTTELNGFSIKDGNANGTGLIQVKSNYFNKISGGGIYIYNSSPVLTNVIISGNDATNGGGIYNNNSSSVLTNVTIRLNNAISNGGGMQNVNSSPVLTNVTVSGNSSYNGSGGGIYNGTSSFPVLTNVIISGNNAYRGAGIFNYSASPVLTNVTISGNNASGSGGGIFNSTDASPKIRNTIIYGNSSGIANVSTAVPVISHSLVQGLLVGSSSSNLGGFHSPWFISSPSFNTAPFTGGDYRLQAGSAVIHKGNYTYYNVDSIPNLSAITTDLDGNPRGMETTSMGVYESSVLSQTIYYVKEDGTGDGTSWANASDDLQLMINSAVAGDQVWVAGGTYYPIRRADALNTISINDRNNAFVLKKAVKIYGGFAGINETTITQRDPTGMTNTTILSGDIGTMGDEADNAYHVVISVGDVGAAELNGFIIKDGNANMSGSIEVSSHDIFTNLGGGIYNSSSSPTLTSVIVNGNDAGFGGGICNYKNSSPVLNNVTISENNASMWGGGIFSDTSNYAIINSTISGNNAGELGGGIYNKSSSPILTNMTVSENFSSLYGGGIYNTLSSPVFTNVTISGNNAINSGGGIYNNFSSSPVLTNVIISGNISMSGGGIFNSSSSSPVFTNVTISGNNATNSGGGIYNNSSSPKIRNTIIYGNSDGIVNINSTPIITYSLVQELTDESNGNKSGNKDPLFANLLSPGLSTGGSYRLKNAESPAYNSGSNDFYSKDSIPNLSAITNDLDGNPRNTKTIDMGAYEYFLAIFYVKEGGTGDGTSWSSASDDLQDMINSSVEWGQVWVAGGTYFPIRRADALNTISLNDRNNAFVLKKDVKIFGGFAGTETTLTQRDSTGTTNKTFLSGDLGTVGDSTDNAYHVVISSGDVGIGGLNSFNIIGGNANGSGSVLVSSDDIFNNSGGGIYNSSSSPVLMNVTINRNDASFGGGISNYKNSSPFLTNVTIRENSASKWGGGIFNDASNYILTNSTILENNADEFGGGIYNASSSPILTNVTVSENIALVHGGGIYNTLSSPVLTGLNISGNNAINSGGGIYNHNSSSPGLTNVNISGNAAGNGGGIYNINSSSPVLTNVTVGGNNATIGGGIYNEVSSFPKIRNTIIYGNSNGIVNNNSTPVITHSLVQGLTDESNGNISGDKDPLFVDPLSPGLSTGGDYRLKNSKSPAYNTGKNFYNMDSIPDLSAITTDLDGNPRNTETINMGAYEHSATLPKIYYVKEGSIGDGTSWASASGDLQGIINSSVAWNQIWVAGGTYYPIRRADALNTISMNDRFNAFVLKKDVKLYGGFAGTEIELNQRDSTRITNNTILSGDLGIMGDIEDNAYHVVISVGNVGAAELNGFSIMDGNAPSVEGGLGIIVLSEYIGIGAGGGIYNTSSSLSLTNLTVSRNKAENGGGILNGSGSPKLTNVIISENNASIGGGIYNAGSSAVLNNVTISGNVASLHGGGIWNQSSSPVLTNVIISGNSGQRGGGINNNASSSPVLTNVAITGNSAWQGAGIYNGSSSSPVLTNVTISGNYVQPSGSGGGIHNRSSSSPTIRNTIIYGNVGGIVNYDGSSVPTITNSLVQELADESNGNIRGDKDPLFVDPLDPDLNTGGNYRLMSNISPAYNGGSISFFNPDSIPDLSAITTDLDGNQRYTETIDMGAYEYASGLPVTIVNFTAQAAANRAKLNWTTATEINNKQFILSRSADGINFSEIGRVAGAGNSSNTIDYLYYDESPMTGNNFYQLEQLDFDGRRTTVGIRNVHFTVSNRINIYPNPVKHTLQLEFKSGVYQKIELTDVNGRLLKGGKIGVNDTRQELNLSTFSSGTYFIRLIGNGYLETRRIVKE